MLYIGDTTTGSSLHVVYLGSKKWSKGMRVQALCGVPVLVSADEVSSADSVCQKCTMAAVELMLSIQRAFGSKLEISGSVEPSSTVKQAPPEDWAARLVVPSSED